MTRRLLPLVTLLAVLAAAAPAAADVIPVRIEGKTSTLFEGPVRTSAGYVQATGDPVRYLCDGTNNDANLAGGASATKAAVDGMRIVGSDFGATWFPGFDDYFIERFGADAQDEDAYDYWGILVDEVFTDVGGCQAKVTEGQRVLWAYDAFHKRGFLTLRAAGDTGAAPATTAKVAVDSSLTVGVTRYYGTAGEQTGPAADVAVGRVDTAADGAQTVRADGRVTTAADGTAEVRFETPGWNRIKATADPSGPIRSNRLDVCVTAPGQTDCGPAPADTAVREAPPLPPIPDAPGTGGTGAPPLGGGTQNQPGAAVGAPVIQFPRFTGSGARRGLVSLRWKILQPGVGVRSWAFGYRSAGRKRGAFEVARKGTTGTTANLRLPAGRAWDVNAAFVDRLGRTVSAVVGDVLVPIDEASERVRRRGGWGRRKDRDAWRGAVQRGRRGATATVRLSGGRPVVLVRSGRRSADVEIRAGRRRQTFRVAGTERARTREVVGARRARGGQVRVRVVRGVADVDGFGVRP